MEKLNWKLLMRSKREFLDKIHVAVHQADMFIFFFKSFKYYVDRLPNLKNVTKLLNPSLANGNVF